MTDKKLLDKVDYISCKRTNGKYDCKLSNTKADSINVKGFDYLSIQTKGKDSMVVGQLSGITKTDFAIILDEKKPVKCFRRTSPRKVSLRCE